MVSIHIEGGTNQYGFAIQRPCYPEIWSTTLSSIATARFEHDLLRCGRNGKTFFILLYKTIILTDIIHLCVIVAESFGGP